MTSFRIELNKKQLSYISPRCVPQICVIFNYACYKDELKRIVGNKVVHALQN